MQYTIGQLRDTIGLTLDGYRHWKKVLPPFIDREGRAPCFSVGDIVGAGVLLRISQRGQIGIGAFRDVAANVLEICNAPWAALEGAVLAIDLEQRKCRLIKEPSPWRRGELTLLCPLDPVLAQVRDMMFWTWPEESQGQLRLPPTELRLPARRAGS